VKAPRRIPVRYCANCGAVLPEQLIGNRYSGMAFGLCSKCLFIPRKDEDVRR
jgi:hypothetical protein